jgi:2-phosphosulfolactate phosphatase
LEAARATYPEHIVVGEWQNEVPPGFDFDNSPLTILDQDFSDNDVLFLSTNGARMLVAASGAKAAVAGSLVNATAVAAYVNDACGPGGTIAIVPAGDNERECDEDSASAAVLAEAISPEVHPQQEPFFLGWLAEIADRGIERLFLESKHGKELQERGRGQDVKFCCQADVLQAVPRVEAMEQVEEFEICVLVSAASSRGC